MGQSHPEWQDAIKYLKRMTRSIPDYPKPGIIFRDLTTIFQDSKGMELSIQLLSELLLVPGSQKRIYDKMVAIESRGFVLGGGIAGKIGGGVVLARKPGKLPYQKQRVDYMLEYGEDSLEMHIDAIQPGEKIVVLDDLLATGGTAEAACKLVEMMGGEIVKILFLVELPDLKGREKLSAYHVDCVLEFSGH
jgi:adenine phosphoribosyltransferase